MSITKVDSISQNLRENSGIPCDQKQTTLTNEKEYGLL